MGLQEVPWTRHLLSTIVWFWPNKTANILFTLWTSAPTMLHIFILTSKASIFYFYPKCTQHAGEVTKVQANKARWPKSSWGPTPWKTKLSKVVLRPLHICYDTQMHNEQTSRTLNILIISSHKLTRESFNPNTSLLSSIKSGLKTLSTDNTFSLTSKLRIWPLQFSK